MTKTYYILMITEPTVVGGVRWHAGDFVGHPYMAISGPPRTVFAERAETFSQLENALKRARDYGLPAKPVKVTITLSALDET